MITFVMSRAAIIEQVKTNGRYLGPGLEQIVPPALMERPFKLAVVHVPGLPEVWHTLFLPCPSTCEVSLQHTCSAQKSQTFLYLADPLVVCSL